MSRYYDPVTHRFINADGYFQSGGNILDANVSAYCANNPVTHSDYSGERYDDEFAERKKARLQQGGKQRRKSNNSITDVTEAIDTAIIPYCTLGSILDNMSTYCSYNPDPENATINYAISTGVKFIVFYNLVDHNAKWDIKNRECWESVIDCRFPGDGVIVKYDDYYMTPENLGNYTYGVLGKSFGIPLSILYAGSYYAAHFPTCGEELSNELNDWKYITIGYNRNS